MSIGSRACMDGRFDAAATVIVVVVVVVVVVNEARSGFLDL